jgi:hypothetical protein
MKIVGRLTMLGAIMLLAGAMLKMSFSNEASYIYTAGAVLFAIMQFIGRIRGGNLALRRLVTMQMMGAAALIVAGILMFTHQRNEWIVAMTIGAMLELYTSFRIPREMDE